MNIGTPTHLLMIRPHLRISLSTVSFRPVLSFRPASLKDYYLSVLRELQSGLNQMIVHAGFDAELRAITQGQLRDNPVLLPYSIAHLKQSTRALCPEVPN